MYYTVNQGIIEEWPHKVGDGVLIEKKMPANSAVHLFFLILDDPKAKVIKLLCLLLRQVSSTKQ
jgi:hypothetical protein